MQIEKIQKLVLQTNLVVKKKKIALARLKAKTEKDKIKKWIGIFELRSSNYVKQIEKLEAQFNIIMDE
jgi:primosomal protein N''